MRARLGRAIDPAVLHAPFPVAHLPPVTRRELVRIAAPAAASAVLNNAFRVIDQHAAGAIGTSAQAAIGACTFVLIAAYAVYSLLAAGAGPLVARATGAGDHALRRTLFGASVTAATATGVVIGFVFGFGADTIAAALGLTGQVAVDAATFLRALAIGAPALALAPLLDACFVAIGRTGAMLALQLGAAVLNAVLNPLFIYGLDLGVAGTGLATVVSRLVCVVLGLVVLWREFAPTRAHLRPDATLLRVLRIGAPVAVNTLLYAGVYFLLLRYTITPLGPVETAALGIGFSALEGMTYPMYMGVSLGVASLVGRHLGAGRPEEAERAARLGFPLATGLGVASGALFWFGAEPLCRFFTDDAAVLAAAVVYARALAWTQVFVAWEALAEGVLGGAGDTRTIFWLSAPLNALRVPLAYILAFSLGWGALGVWWAINFTSVLKATGKGVAAARGAWTRLAV